MTGSQTVNTPVLGAKVSVNYNSTSRERPVSGEETFGPWMLAKKNNRRGPTGRSPAHVKNPATEGVDARRKNGDVAGSYRSGNKEVMITSRFAAIAEDSEVSDMQINDLGENTDSYQDIAAKIAPAVPGNIAKSSLAKKGFQYEKKKLHVEGTSAAKIQKSTLSNISNGGVQKKDSRPSSLAVGKENKNKMARG